MDGIVPGARLPANVWLNENKLSISARSEREHAILSEAILTGRANSVFIPNIEVIDHRLMARFLAKVALEILAERVLQVEGWQDEIVDNQALDSLRHFARVGDRPANWPYSRRRIYGEDDIQVTDEGGHQVLHEFTLLCEPLPEPGHFDLHAVLCIFGEEFAINMGEPEIATYERWLSAHNRTSPLYLTDTLPVPPASGDSKHPFRLS